MPKVSVADAYPSKWLSSSDLDGDTILTLADDPLDYEEFKQPGKSTPDRKPILYFRSPRGTKQFKPMVLNKINFTMLLMLLGDDTDTWPGRQIIIGVDMVEAFNKLTPGLRIRNRLPKPKAAPAKSAQVSQPRPQEDFRDDENIDDYYPIDDDPDVAA